MSISELGSLGEFVAAIATLATLIYLAIQVSQAKREFRESTQERLADRPAEIQLAWLSCEALSSTMNKAFLTDEKLSREEAYQFGCLMPIFFGILFEYVRLQEREKVGDSDELTQFLNIYGPYLQMPRVRRWWVREGQQLFSRNERGCTLISTMIREVELENEPVQQPSDPSA